MGFEEELRESLRSLSTSAPFIRLYEEIRARRAIFASFPSPEAVLLFLHERNPEQFEFKDDLLRALIQETQATGHPDLANYLIRLLLPGLGTIIGRYRGKLPGLSIEELWSQVYLFCLEVIATYPIHRRPRKIAKNLLLDTLSKTSAWFKGEIRRRRRERGWLEKWEPAVETEEAAGEEPSIAQPGLDAMPAWTSHADREESLLDRLVRLRVITREEADLILKTRLLGRPLRGFPGEPDRRAYDRLIKRRQRAEARIRGFLEHLRRKWAQGLGLDPREVSLPEVIELLQRCRSERSG